MNVLNLKSKHNFLIQQYGNNITILTKKKLFGVFNQWVELTEAETENSPELPLRFNSIDEAKSYIENLVK